MCIYSAVRTVPAAAAAAAVRHCTPATRGVFHTAAVPPIFIASCTNERSLQLVEEVHPLAEQSLFLCSLGFTYY